MRWLVRRRDRPIFAPPPSRWRWLSSLLGVMAACILLVVLAAVLLGALIGR